ncbi:MAG: PAS domain-containing protein [Nitrospiraceae bacterium]|nr:PAS domain-containing protein [Nitrospiraceae bacterium]
MGERHSDRVPVRFDTKIILAGKAYDGYVTNISEDGIGCSITSVLKAPKDFIPIRIPELRFSLPDGRAVALKCELAWFTGAGPEDQRLTLGLKIIDPPREYRNFVKDLSSNHPDLPQGDPSLRRATPAPKSPGEGEVRPKGAPLPGDDVYRAMVESAGDSIYILDTGCRYLFMNQEHQARLNISGAQCLGWAYGDFHSASETGEINGKILEVVASGVPLSYEHQSERENKYYLRTLSPLKGQDGKVIAVAVVSKNITDRKLAEELLLKANRELERQVEERTAALIELNENLQREITGHRETEAAMKQASEDWRITFDSTRDMMLMLDREFRVIKVNRATSDHLKKPYAQIIGRSFYEIFNNMEVPADGHPLEIMQQSKGHVEQEVFLRDGDIWVLTSADPILSGDAVIAGAVVIIRDITEQKNLQRQLLQSQKMESIGRLAGGVAHDFNNILSSIIGYTELALMKLPAEGLIRDYLCTVKESGEKAAALVQRLLAFSRKQVLQMQTIDLNRVIESMTKMMTRLIREDIALEVHADPAVLPVLADPLQIEQIVMNLIINARDAMPEGGTLIIETSNVVFDDDFVISHENVRPGPYVLLSVSDTGIGMSRQVQAKIFEPFFTTKSVGEGTGLGLATVYGIVSQHNGYIYVYSEPGQGTTFKIYLPVSSEHAGGTAQKENSSLPRGSETLLVVDDDPTIRKLIRDVLQPLGYTLLFAHDGQEALSIAARPESPVTLLLTDVIMPNMNGRQLADLFRSGHPGSKVVFMSGYTNETIAQQGILNSRDVLIQKPLSHASLANVIREVLDAP